MAAGKDSQTRLGGATLAASAALLAAIALVRSPGLLFGVLNVDETDFLLIARKILAGGLPYVDAVETKPPLVYLLYLPGALAGVRMWPMQLLGIGWVFATLWVLKSTADLWTGRSEVGWAAAWLGLLAYCCDVPAVNTELFLNLPVAAALFFFVRAQQRSRSVDWLYCGLCAGLATLFKHQAGILVLALVAAQLWFQIADLGTHRAPARDFLRIAWMGTGFVLPWAAALSFYAVRGELSAFWEWNLVRNLSYATNGATGDRLIRAAKAIGVCVIGGTPLPWLLSLSPTPGRSDRIRRTLALLLALTWIPVCLGGRFYEHYFLQFVPPLALLGAERAAAVVKNWRTFPRLGQVALSSVALIPPIALLVVGVSFGLRNYYPTQDQRVVALARWLDANSQPMDKLFVWGHFSPIYYLSGREPGTRYLSTSVHMGNFDPHHLPNDFDAAAHRSAVDVKRTLRDLEANKPPWIVDTAPADIHDWAKIPLSKFPELERYVTSKYELVAHPGGTAVYRRIEASKLSLRRAGLGN